MIMADFYLHKFLNRFAQNTHVNRALSLNFSGFVAKITIYQLRNNRSLVISVLSVIANESGGCAQLILYS